MDDLDPFATNQAEQLDEPSQSEAREVEPSGVESFGVVFRGGFGVKAAFIERKESTALGLKGARQREDFFLQRPEFLGRIEVDRHQNARQGVLAVLKIESRHDPSRSGRELRLASNPHQRHHNRTFGSRCESSRKTHAR